MFTYILIALMLSCYLTTSFAYCKVYRIIRHHQQQVQGNETSQNFGQPAIDLAKYKRSLASMMYIALPFSFCFIPYIVLGGATLTLVEVNPQTAVVHAVFVVLVFLSSSLYLWRMNDIRNGVRQLFCREF